MREVRPVEPAFVGESRHLFVDGLVESFDRVNEGEGPVWVSLEAPSGWGKTRAVREFYARLAADRQSEPQGGDHLGYLPAKVASRMTDAAEEILETVPASA